MIESSQRVFATVLDHLTGPTDEEVRAEWDPADRSCPRCCSEDYWATQDQIVTVYRCLECGAEGAAPIRWWSR